MQTKDKKQEPSRSGSCGVSLCVTQSALLHKQLCLRMLHTVSHWSGLRPLDSATPQQWSHALTPLRSCVLGILHLWLCRASAFPLYS